MTHDDGTRQSTYYGTREIAVTDVVVVVVVDRDEILELIADVVKR